MKPNFDNLFLRYHKPLCFFAERIVRDKSASEDIVQEVFITLLKRIHQFDHERQVKSFLYLATKNACLNYLKRIKSISIDGYDFPSGDSLLNEIIRAEVIRELLESIEKLPPGQRQIINLSLKGLTTKEIAAKLSISENTVQNQRLRAKNKLKKNL